MRWIAAIVFAGLMVNRSQAVTPVEDELHRDGLHRGPSANRLQGDYGLTTKESCVRTPFQAPTVPGFDASTNQLLVGADAADAVGSGVMHFSPDGTVSVNVVGTELEINQLAAGDIPVSVGVTYECDGTYELQSGDQAAVTFPSCKVSSKRPGVTVTVGPLNLTGYIAEDRATMNLSEVNGTIETVAVSAGGSVVQQRQRICVASFGLSAIRSAHSR